VPDKQRALLVNHGGQGGALGIHPANYPDRHSLECALDRTMVSANSERRPLWVALALTPCEAGAYCRGCR
jgi:hypothetical protein